jgi:aspartate/tyrosine/aromatic aminotransferase
VTDRVGNILGSGTLDATAAGERFYTRCEQDVDVWVGASTWDIFEEILEDNANNGE